MKKKVQYRLKTSLGPASMYESIETEKSNILFDIECNNERKRMEKYPLIEREKACREMEKKLFEIANYGFKREYE